jgi:hypothetical protein
VFTAQEITMFPNDFRATRAVFGIAATLVTLILTTPAAAQGVGTSPTRGAIRLSGPRVGVTMFSGPAADSLHSRLGIGPTISQFGWQFETKMFQIEGGMTGIHEFLVLVGGLDAGVALPSATWLLGIRNPSGIELGVGPNVSLAGLALAAGAGFNIQSGGVNFPINFGVASSKYGLRTSMFVGFNTKNVGL